MRRAGAPRREVLPDPKYGSRLIAKFVNIMMIRGKKSTAERIMYDALAAMEDRAKQDPLKMFKSAIDNVKPAVGSSRDGAAARPIRGRPRCVPIDGHRCRCGGSSAPRCAGPTAPWPRG